MTTAIPHRSPLALALLILAAAAAPALAADQAAPKPSKATKPGKHPINGLIRVGYIHGTDEMAMVSMPLVASVTGAE